MGLFHLPVLGGFIPPPRHGGDRELITYTQPFQGMKLLCAPTHLGESPACSLACTLGGKQAMRTGLTLGI